MKMTPSKSGHPVFDPQSADPGFQANTHPIKIIILIPVYNHFSTLRGVVAQALHVHDEIMVLDDGSTDNVLNTLEGLDVHKICHPKNLGKGAAIMTAAREARRLGMTHMVTIDADGQHNPDDFNCFLPAIRKTPDAIIVGKRNFRNTNVPKANRFGRSFSNFWLRVQTGKSLGDVQSGFRAYPISVLENLKLHEKRYTFEVEVLVKAAWAGVELRQVDVSVYYPPAKERISHFRLFVDNLRLSFLNTKLTMRSVAPLPHKKIVDSNHIPPET